MAPGTAVPGQGVDWGGGWGSRGRERGRPRSAAARISASLTKARGLTAGWLVWEDGGKIGTEAHKKGELAMAGRCCPLCREIAQVMSPCGTRRHLVCRTCGEYFISIQAENSLLNDASRGVNASQRAQLSWVTRERTEQGSPITILSETPDAATGEADAASIRQILEAMVPHSDEERIDRALRNLNRKAPELGHPVAVEPARDYPLLFAEDPCAAQLMLKHMAKHGLLEQSISFDQGDGEYTLTPDGRRRVDGLQSAAHASAPADTSATALVSALNVEWKQTQGFKLFDLASFEPLDSLGGQCQDKKDYHARVLALAVLMKDLNESAMRETLSLDLLSSCQPGHTLSVLDVYVRHKGFPQGVEAVAALRKVQRLRNLPPIHRADDKAGFRAIEELKGLGFPYPVPEQDWSRAWQATLDLFSNGLQLLREDLEDL